MSDGQHDLPDEASHPVDAPIPAPGPTASVPVPGPTASTATLDPPHGAPPPMPHPPSTQRPPFRRTSGGKVVAGVAGGLARSMSIDPVIIRIVLVILALNLPQVVLAYIAAWWLVPADNEAGGRTHGMVVLKDGGLVFWIVAAILIGSSFVFGGSPVGFGGFPLIPLVLIGIGVALWTRDGSPRPRAGVPGAPVAPGAPAAPVAGAGWGDTAAWPQHPTGGAAAPPPLPPLPTAQAPAPPPGPPVRLPRKPRSRLGAVTLAVALIAAGVAAALDAGGSVTISGTEVAAIAMLVLGVGMLVGSVFGRAKWLSLIAMLLLPPVLFGSLIREVTSEFDIQTDLGVADGLGERYIDVEGDEDLPNDVKLLAGSIELDLERWTPDAAALAALDGDGPDLVVEVGAGEVIVRLPDDVAWRVVANVGIGEVDLRDRDGNVIDSRSIEEFGSSLRVVHEGGADSGPVLDIQIEVALGYVDVRPSALDEGVEPLAGPLTITTTHTTASEQS